MPTNAPVQFDPQTFWKKLDEAIKSGVRFYLVEDARQFIKVQNHEHCVDICVVSKNDAKIQGKLRDVSEGYEGGFYMGAFRVFQEALEQNPEMQLLVLRRTRCNSVGEDQRCNSFRSERVRMEYGMYQVLFTV